MQKVRRYDIFAIFNFIKNVATMGEAQAKGEAIWLCKVVASRKFGSGKRSSNNAGEKPERKESKWKSLSGIEQTDKVYDKEIVNRFGSKYSVVFHAVEKAIQKGIDYKAMRDCQHGRGWCQECSENFATEFKTQILT